MALRAKAKIKRWSSSTDMNKWKWYHISKGLTCCIFCSDVLLDFCILYKIHNTANTVYPPYFSTTKWGCWSVYQNTGTIEPSDEFLFRNAINLYPLLNQVFYKMKIGRPMISEFSHKINHHCLLLNTHADLGWSVLMCKANQNRSKLF